MEYIKRVIKDLVSKSDRTFKCVLATGAQQAGRQAGRHQGRQEGCSGAKRQGDA